MGLDISFYPIPSYSWKHDHIRVMTAIHCERSPELYHQFDAYGFPPEDPENEAHIPYAVVKLQPVPEGKIFRLLEEPEPFESDRIGQSSSQHNFVFLYARDFHKINADIIEHHIAKAAVHFMRALPGDWPVLVWRG